MDRSLSSYLGLPDASKVVPNPSASLAKLQMAAILERDVPAQNLQSLWQQADSYTGIIYLCVKALADAAMMSTVRVTTKRKKPQKTTLLMSGSDGRVHKALPTAHSQSNDWEQVPVDDEHELAQLLANPNDVDTFQDFLASWVLFENLYGEAVIWPRMQEGFEMPAELWTIPRPLLSTMPISEMYPSGGFRVYNWYPGSIGLYASGGWVALDRREVWWHKYQGPLYRWQGWSPLTGAGAPMDVLNAILRSWRKTMLHGWSADTIIGLPGVAQDEIDRWQTLVERKYAGADGMRTLILGGDTQNDMTIATPNGNSAKDMGYSEAWMNMIRVACGTWGTNSTVIGLEPADSFSSYFAKLKQYYTHGLMPKFNSISRFLTKHLAKKYWPDENLTIEIDLPKIDDPEQLEKKMARGMQGLQTFNELRALDGLDPMDGGDVIFPVFIESQKPEQPPQPEANPFGGGGGNKPPGAKPPMMGGEEGGEENPEGESHPFDGIADAVLANLGVSDDTVMKGGAKAPKGGVTIAGTFYPGGRFIPNEELKKASPSEKAKLAAATPGGVDVPELSGPADASKPPLPWDKPRSTPDSRATHGKPVKPNSVPNDDEFDDEGLGKPLGRPLRLNGEQLAKDFPVHLDRSKVAPEPSQASGNAPVAKRADTPLPVAKKVQQAKQVASSKAPELAKSIADAFKSLGYGKKDAATHFQSWVGGATEKHAAKVSQSLGVNLQQAKSILTELFQHLFDTIMAMWDSEDPFGVNPNPNPAIKKPTEAGGNPIKPFVNTAGEGSKGPMLKAFCDEVLREMGIAATL